MRQDGNETNWRIPDGDREAVVIPPPEKWPEVARTNRRLNQARSVHRQIVAGALTYTRDLLGEEAKLPNEGDPLVLVTGHQPGFCHPGVWFKNFLVAEAARQNGAVAVNLIVDTDEVGVLGALVPSWQDGWRQTRVALLTGRPQETFEHFPPPERSQIERFAAELAPLVHTGYPPETRKNVQRFLTLLDQEEFLAAPRELGLAGWLTALRRRYEGDLPGYLEYPVSRLAELPAFKAFAAQIITDAAAFTNQYNQTLAAYRLAHGYRYKVNPFPDLQREETTGEYELPFWVKGTAGRFPVFVRLGAQRRSLCTEEQTLLSWEGALTPEQLVEVPLRPRGMVLTLFMRLFGCDLFLHGIGGAKYDGATSQFIRDYYGQEPPEYAGATLTLQPALELVDLSVDEVRRLEELLRDVEHNPDRYLLWAGLSQSEQERLSDLARQKEDLIARIKTAGADRKALGLQIKELNQQIGVALQGYREELTERLHEKKRQLAAIQEAKRRDYAYFLFDPDELKHFTKL